MKTLLPLHVLFMFSTVLFGQGAGSKGLPRPEAPGLDWIVQGKVTELVTGRGIATATVEAIDSHQIVYRTLSNPDGTFRLEHLPHEPSVVVRCSQLGYSPNPRGAKTAFTHGIATWNPQLVPEDADAAYLHAAADYVASLPPGADEATDLAVYLPNDKRSVIAADLQRKMQSNRGDPNLNFDVGLFSPGPTSDKAIATAVNKQFFNETMTNFSKWIAAHPLSVDVTNGVVTISGSVKTIEDKELVYRSINDVPSVASINDKLTVQPSRPMADHP